MSSTARSSACMSDNQPPRKKRTKQSPEISIFCLPFDLIFNILSRVSRLYYPTLSLASKKIRSVIASPELYETRSRLNRTERCLYVCLRYHRDSPLDPNPYWFTLCKKPNRTLTDDGSRGLLLIPIASPDVRHEPSSSVVAVGSNIYKMGAHTPSSTEVSVLDCRFNTWQSGPVMREKRSSPAASVVDGKIYVAGGCEDLTSGNCVEVFDPKTQTWGSVSNPAVKTQLQSFGIGGKLYLLGGVEDVVYDPKEASWSPMGLHVDMHNEAMAMGLEMYEAIDMEMDANGVASAASYYHGVIGDVLILWIEREFRWYDFTSSSWKKLNGLEDLPDLEGDFKMVDLGGKMAVLWKVFGRSDEHGDQERSIWCAEIALEKRDGDEMWGNVEWCDAVLTNYEPCGLFDADVLCATV